MEVNMTRLVLFMAFILVLVAVFLIFVSGLDDFISLIGVFHRRRIITM